LQTPERGAVLAWPVVWQGRPVIAADRAVDFSESAAAIGDAGLRVRQQCCGFGVFQRRRWTAACGEQKSNRGQRNAPARSSLQCLPRCRIGVGLRSHPHRNPPIPCPNRCRHRSAPSETLETRNTDISRPPQSEDQRRPHHGAAHTGFAFLLGGAERRAGIIVLLLVPPSAEALHTDSVTQGETCPTPRLVPIHKR
jgi:hypothetical protein